jgi:hypothetical protein
MKTVAVQHLDERTRSHEGESLSARSPLSEAEKEAIVRAEYFPTAHRIGLITSLIHVVVFFLPAIYLTVFYGLPVDWGKIMQGAATTWSFSMPLWFIEPVSYFLDQGIYWSRLRATGWEAQQNVRGVGTSHSPALVFFQNRLFMFWKGIGGDSRVYYSSLDAAPNAIWQAQRLVEYPDAQSNGIVMVQIGTSRGPSVTQCGNRLLVTWKGIEGTRRSTSASSTVMHSRTRFMSPTSARARARTSAGLVLSRTWCGRASRTTT